MSVITDLFRNIMRGARAIVVQPYTEANVKNGLQFYIRRAFRGPTQASVTGGAFTALGQKRYLYFQVGNTPIIVKDRVVKYFGEEFALRIYNATGQTAPTLAGQLTVTNYRNDGGGATSLVAVHEVLTADVGPLGNMIGDPEYYFGGTAEGQRNPN